MRDLLLGPKRFTDLHLGLAQGSPNVLSQRLRELEEAGVVRRRRLPPPASANVYELTDWGAELEPIVLGLQRWGARSRSLPHDVPVGCDAAMLALKNTFDPEAADGVRLEAEVRFDTDTFRVTVDNGRVEVARGQAHQPDLVIETDPQTLEALAFAGRSIRSAQRAGTLRIDGDAEQLDALLKLFDPATL